MTKRKALVTGVVAVAVDGIEGAAEPACAAWPERTYIVGPGGRIVDKGGGPAS